MLVLALAAAIALSWRQVERLEALGYGGVFLISLLSSATILIPVPSLAVVFALGGVLGSPALVGVLVGVAEPIGELTGYIAGATGRQMVAHKPGRVYSRLDGWMQRRGGITLFVLSAFPNPFIDLVGVVAGSSRYPLWRFLLFCWAGKTIKGLMVAFAGAWGLGLVLRWLERLGF